ncbi:DUF4394 domain-containing protein [Azohydromonas aeria]|uniref:DUF4394 domain-containing protein n=1 Tax=Azohydromonas aeria TaxID=2590212 RepID=UPI0012F9BC9A|nr:DUF4394 domain-containing protein [Azohydromonas aeria]
MLFHKKTLTAAAAAALVLSLAACGGSGDDDDDAPPPPVAVGDTVLLTASGRLLSFDRATPGTQVGSVAVTGLAAGETLLGIDVRPADGQLYALSSAGRLYTLDPATGAATLKSTLVADAADTSAPFTALAGTRFGVDFNPVADRLRVVGDTGQNLRINVDSGATITDGAIAAPAGTTASVTAAAYTNSFAGTATTLLYDIDAATGRLHVQNPPNDGVLDAGVALGVTGTAVNGFDIDAANNQGYVVLESGGARTLHRIDLAAATPTVTALGAVGGGEAVVGLALRQAARATAWGLTTDNRLVSFDPRAPGTLTGNVAITGLAAGETVAGIDFRPADGRLYALARLGTGGRLYTIDPATGAATAGPALVNSPANAVPFAGLAGTAFSVDFNPAADRLRVIGDGGQSLRINVADGGVLVDGSVNRAGTPTPVAAAAYTNNFAMTVPATTLFDLDAAADVLARQDPPNAGTLVDVGALGLDIGAAAFDIAGGGNAAYAAFGTAGTGPFSLYAVSLATGAATPLPAAGGAASQIGGPTGPALLDIAVRVQ